MNLDMSKHVMNLNDITHRIHGAGIYTNIGWGYIDGIHVTIYSSTMDPMGNANHKQYCVREY